jgi:hypothetical protein
MPKTALLVSLMQAINVGLEILHQLGFALSQNITDSKGKKHGEWYKLQPNS